MILISHTGQDVGSGMILVLRIEHDVGGGMILSMGQNRKSVNDTCIFQAGGVWKWKMP